MFGFENFVYVCMMYVCGICMIHMICMQSL